MNGISPHSITTVMHSGLPGEMQTKRPDNLYIDTVNLLDHRFAGHMGVWAYLNGGRPYLEKFFESDGYDGTKEIPFIPEIAKRFYHDMPDKISLIELGPGKAYTKKTTSFIEAFNEASKSSQTPKRIVEYFSLDIVPDYAREASSFISNKYNMVSSPILADFTGIETPIETLATPVIISWNSPIWNSAKVPAVGSDFVYASDLSKIGRVLGNNGTLILTHFPMRDANERVLTYKDDNCRQAVLAITNLIEKRLKPECHLQGGGVIRFSDLFDYDVSINPRDEVVSMDLVSKHAATITIGDYSVSTLSGERFNAVRSAKPSIRRFNNIARLGNASVINTHQSTDGSVIAQALQFSV